VISLRDVVMIHDLKKQGLSNTAIARQLGISRRTVTRRLRQGLEAPSYGPRPAKARLFEPFEGYLQDRVTASPDLSGRRLLREVKQPGYTGGYSALTSFLREVRPPSVQLYERRFETPPGQQGQVDFAYFEVEFTDAPGVKQAVWLFTPCGAVGPRTPHGGARLQPFSLGPVLPEPEARHSVALPYRRVRGTWRCTRGDPLRSHEDGRAGQRRGGSRDLQPVARRPRQSPNLVAEGATSRGPASRTGPRPRARSSDPTAMSARTSSSPAAFAISTI
jgi:hypothetical protein